MMNPVDIYTPFSPRRAHQNVDEDLACDGPIISHLHISWGTELLCLDAHYGLDYDLS